MQQVRLPLALRFAQSHLHDSIQSLHSTMPLWGVDHWVPLELLSYVAVKKFEQQQYVLFEQEELEGYIEEFLGIERRDSRGVLQAIASQHGLLIERSQKVWSFSHLISCTYRINPENTNKNCKNMTVDQQPSSSKQK